VVSIYGRFDQIAKAVAGDYASKGGYKIPLGDKQRAFGKLLWTAVYYFRKAQLK